MSGTWARDFNRVRELQSRLTVAPNSPLWTAIRFNRQVHIRVAARLVPEGRSLLQDSGRSLREQPTAADSDTVDAFFRTGRHPVCRHGFAAQLRTRTEAVLADLAALPIYAEYEHAAIREFLPAAADHIATPLRLGEPLLLDGKR
ncbi:hypothetical protein [Nocardia sp. BMG111209]|uniref:hypothetical protein n=1 Tax=Nocardia sp. BMG111209 TaxID=1160137 RepID=UPI00037B51CE|nr:hypothetical protein [Nocardia sp. BMG111209]